MNNGGSILEENRNKFITFARKLNMELYYYNHT